MMLTADILVVQKVINYLVEYAPTNCLISMTRNLLINDLICPIDEPFLEPKFTVACLPDCSTRVAKLSTAAGKKLISFPIY